MEGIAAEDLHEQLLVTVARVKALIGYSKEKQEKLIRAAQLTDASFGMDTVETPDDTEEAELDEARYLMEAEDLAGDDQVELLAEREENRMGLNR